MSKGQTSFTQVYDITTENISSSASACWCDIDSDGDDDLIVMNGYGSLDSLKKPQQDELFINQGGKFSKVRNHVLVDSLFYSGIVLCVDYDNDGDNDLFKGNQDNVVNLLYTNDQNVFSISEKETFSENLGESFSAIWVDVDNDGWLDLHIFNGRSNLKGQTDRLYRNVSGKLAAVENVAMIKDSLPSGGGVWGDFDSDGDQDFFLPVNDGVNSNRLYRNNGNWNFTDITSKLEGIDDPLPFKPRTSYARWVDVDNDLDLDLFIGNFSSIDYLLFNNGQGSLLKNESSVGDIGIDHTYVSDIAWGDIDNDADIDLIMVNWGCSSSIYLNDGTGNFISEKINGFGNHINFASSVTLNDINSDGQLDIFLTQWPINIEGGMSNEAYYNDGNKNNWIKVRLEGMESNKSAIGTSIIVRVIIDGKQVDQMRTVLSRTSWRASDGLTQHFGLSNASKIKEIEVRWPSGLIETIENIDCVNCQIKVTEGHGYKIQTKELKMD